MISEHLLKQIVDLSVTNFAILTTPLPFDYKKELQENNVIEEIFFFSQLMDVSLSYASAKKYALGRNVPSDKIRDKKIVNVRNVIEFIKSPVSGRELSLQILQHLNKLLTEGTVDIWDAGRLRNPGDRSATPRIFKQPLQDMDMYANVNETLGLLYGNQGSNVVMRIGRTLRTLFILCPFFSYSDETVILASKYLFHHGGFCPYISSARIFQHRKEPLKEAIGSEDQWLEVFAQGLYEELQNLYTRVKPRSLLKEDKKKTGLLELNRRQMRLLKYISDNGAISREVAAKLNDTSIATAYRDLDFLCKKNLTKRAGSGKNTYYTAQDIG